MPRTLALVFTWFMLLAPLPLLLLVYHALTVGFATLVALFGFAAVR